MSPAVQVGLSAFLKLIDVVTVLYMSKNQVQQATDMQDMRRDLMTGKISRDEAELLVERIHVDAMAELDAAIDALPPATYNGGRQ